MPVSAQLARTLAGVRVLLVDDDDDLRDMIAMVLEESGAVVTQARTANEALDAFIAATPDVLVSDLGMPAQDGFGLLRSIRAIEATSGGEVLAVALSGYARAPGREPATAGGFAAHLVKPVVADDLLRTLADLLRARSPRR